ncbi:uncharacterized protein ATNIH1004_005096 [Aspergillus tanneri]|uniref:Uncharacterized protein n=1 Tax=Aspergillus tanneri TaxID=1220188 RepID=A0A5M9MQ18_9EURO|nr:uncharacterized protein ATNIH1004_005096 [Aspergillus tanneri]KAA8649201.1 hypothetical protein ATNIH1004_005096 [Aspergillus tanneri]
MERRKRPRLLCGHFPFWVLVLLAACGKNPFIYPKSNSELSTDKLTGQASSPLDYFQRTVRPVLFIRRSEPDHETMGEEGSKGAEPSIKPDIHSQELIDAGSSGAPPARRLASNHASDQRSPRSSPPSRANQQASQSRKFEFVLVTDSESRRQVRRHAMRQYMHQRRLDSIARLGTSRIPVGGWATRQASDSATPGTSSRIESVEDESPTKSERDSPSTDEEQPILQKGKSPSQSLVPKSHKVKREEETSPLLSSFNSSDPLELTNSKVVVTYPSMMYKFVDRVAGNPMMEIFRQFALHDELPFQAMLAIASKHRAGVEGKVESVQSLTHKMRALRLMNERLRADSTGQNDGTIYSVATMAVIEVFEILPELLIEADAKKKWSKDASIERVHFRGLASMIRNRGGMRGMRISSPFLEKVLYWVDFSCAPKAIVSTSLPWTGAVPDSPPAGFDFLSPDLHLGIPHDSTTDEGSESLCDHFRACEDFLRFFRHLHELERAALNSTPDLISKDAHRRIKQFSPGTQLHIILTMIPDYDHGIRDVRFIDDYTGMSCLVFLAVALHDCYLKSLNFDHYLEWLSMEVKKLNPHANPSITAILWLFLNNGGYPRDQPGDSGDRCWVVSRFMRIVKRLEWKRQGTIWDHIRQALIDFVMTQQECALGSDDVDEEALVARQYRARRSPTYLWDEDQMREYILNIKNPPPATTYFEMNAPIIT